MNEYRVLKNIHDLTITDFAVMFSDVVDENVSRNQFAAFTRGDTRFLDDEHLNQIRKSIANEVSPEFTEKLRQVYAFIDTLFMRDDSEEVMVNPNDMDQFQDEFGAVDGEAELTHVAPEIKPLDEEPEVKDVEIDDDDEFGDLDDVLSIDDQTDALYDDDDSSDDNDALSDDALDALFGDEETNSAVIKDVPPITEDGPWDDVDFDSLPESDGSDQPKGFDDIVDIDDDLDDL